MGSDPKSRASEHREHGRLFQKSANKWGSFWSFPLVIHGDVHILWSFPLLIHGDLTTFHMLVNHWLSYNIGGFLTVVIISRPPLALPLLSSGSSRCAVQTLFKSVSKLEFCRNWPCRQEGWSWEERTGLLIWGCDDPKVFYKGSYIFAKLARANLWNLTE